MNNAFNNQIIWIIGASSGYGRALSEYLSRSGAKLILSARREDVLSTVSDNIKESLVLPFDLSKSEMFPQVIHQAFEFYNKIDRVIFTAGIAQDCLAHEVLPFVARFIMEINYFGPTEMVRQIIPYLESQGNGHIVVVSGILERIPLAGRSSYSASKAALHAYFDCLRTELYAKNIDITVLIPGVIRTNFAGKAIQADGKPKNKIINNDGCYLDKAVRQTLFAIGNRYYECFIGNEKDKMIWNFSLSDHNLLIKKMLEDK